MYELGPIKKAELGVVAQALAVYENHTCLQAYNDALDYQLLDALGFKVVPGWAVMRTSHGEWHKVWRPLDRFEDAMSMFNQLMPGCGLELFLSARPAGVSPSPYGNDRTTRARVVDPRRPDRENPSSLEGRDAAHAICRAVVAYFLAREEPPE